jgi:hypothetical protein
MILGFRSIVIALVGCPCAAAAVCIDACVIAPPAELPPPKPLPPRILHDSVTPPAGVPLPAWPDAPDSPLIVPVVVEDTTRGFDVRVFVDQVQSPEPLSPEPSPVDGGPMLSILSIYISPQQPNRVIDLGACHVIKVVVARSFLSNNEPDALGGDSVSWPYYPTLSAPYTCTVAEAGAGVPPVDASADALPVPPLSEGGDL